MYHLLRSLALPNTGNAGCSSPVRFLRNTLTIFLVSFLPLPVFAAQDCVTAVGATAMSVTSPVCSNTSVTFSATASVNVKQTRGTINYQLYLNGTAISGATGSLVSSGSTSYVLQITYAVKTSGPYTIVVTSNACTGQSVTSSAGVALTVNTAPAITAQPQSVSSCSNTPVGIGVTATGTNLSYQWQVNTSGNTWSNVSNGSVYSNVTTATLTISAISSLNGNNYRVIVSGQSPCGSVTSGTATLTISLATAITIQPVNTSACSGGSANFSVTAAGGGLTYQWQMSTNGGTSYANVPENSTYSGTTAAQLIITRVSSSMNGYLFRVLTNSSCGNVTSANATLSTTGVGYTWSGSANSQWSDSRNWSCGIVPNSDTADVIIVGGTNPAVIDPHATYSIRNITLTSGAKVNLNGALNISGSINNSGGTFNAATGTINMKGSALQTIAGSYFAAKTLQGLTIDNPVQVTLLDSLFITDVLNVSSGVFNAANQNITLRSTASNTARIAPVNGALRNSTNVTVERYIPAERRAYRILAPSVNTSGSINANWQESAHNLQFGTNINPKPRYGMFITGSGGAANLFDQTRTNQPSVYTYDPATLSWVSIPNTSSTMSAKTGYLAFVRGDRGIDMTIEGDSLPPSATTLRTTGTVQVGNQVYTNLTHADYSLVTNPYPSPINWTSICASNNSSLFDNYYTYWDPTIGTRGGYVTVTSGGANSVGTNATTEIQSGQAVFVHSKDAGAGSYDFTIRESDKSTTGNINVFSATTSQPQLHTSLYYTNAQGFRQIADGTLCRFDAGYSKGVDEWDALEIANWDENIAWTISNKQYSIQAYPLPSADTLKMYMSHMKVRNYELQFSPDNMDGQAFNARLKDKFTNTSTPISMSGVTVIPFSVTSDPVSAASDRFSVVFGASGALPVTFTGIKAQQENKGIKVQWALNNQANADYYEVEKSTTGAAFTKSVSVAANGNESATYNWFDANPSTGANCYRVKMTDKSGAVAYSNVAKVNISNGHTGVAVYPNPVHGTSITLQLTDIPAGAYNVTLTNNTGSLVYSSVITHAGGSATQTINLDRSIASGTYQLRVGTYTMQVIKR